MIIQVVLIKSLIVLFLSCWIGFSIKFYFSDDEYVLQKNVLLSALGGLACTFVCSLLIGIFGFCVFILFK